MDQTSNVTIDAEAFSSYAHIIFEYTDGSVDSIITIRIQRGEESHLMSLYQKAQQIQRSILPS
jgi:hypothetical protein